MLLDGGELKLGRIADYLSQGRGTCGSKAIAGPEVAGRLEAMSPSVHVTAVCFMLNNGTDYTDVGATPLCPGGSRKTANRLVLSDLGFEVTGLRDGQAAWLPDAVSSYGSGLSRQLR